MAKLFANKEYWEGEARLLAMRQWTIQEEVDTDFVPEEYLDIFNAAYYEEVDRLYQIGPSLEETLN